MDYKTTLEKLGYQLTDCGAFWQSNAVYRGGDNPKALQIYKNSGVWKDYVDDTEYLPFEALIERTLNTTDKLAIREITKSNGENYVAPTKKDLLKSAKTYPEKCLKKLLPHYDFYTKKGISIPTLQSYKCGLATGGDMYQRIVFPIYNQEEKIIGFSGRKVESDSERPKWKHTGKKSDWFHPYFISEECRESIKESRSVFLVESIGDSMALFDCGTKNNLITFGISPSASFIAKLAALDVDKIFISYNNDFDGEVNRGYEGGYKAAIKLLESIDYRKIYFAPPSGNDFGAMDKIAIETYMNQTRVLTHQFSSSMLIDIGKKMNQRKPQGEKFTSSLKKLIKTHDFNYGF